MSLGLAVRKLLPQRAERLAADVYRRIFVNLDTVADSIAALGKFHRVIEVGCGEGSMMTRLMDRLPADASAVGIDISPTPGFNYAGRNPDVTFRSADVATVVAEGERFDLVVVSDVLHHIPPAERAAFLASCRELLSKNGTIVVKEWVKRRNVAHLLAYTSDRYISGDRAVSFYDYAAFRSAFMTAFVTAVEPGDPTLIERQTKPHPGNNVILALTRN